MNSLCYAIITLEQFILLYNLIKAQIVNFTKLNKFILLTFCGVVSIVINYIIVEYSLLLFGICILPLFIIYKYKFKYSNNYCLVCFIMLCTINYFCEIVPRIIIHLYYNVNIINIMYQSQNIIYVYLLIRTISTIFFIILNYEIKISNNEMLKEAINNFSAKQTSVLLVLGFTTLISDLMNIIFDLPVYEINILYTINLVVGILALLTMIISIFAHCYIKLKEELIQQVVEKDSLNEIVDNLRIVKHDYDNILQSINGYIATKQYDELGKHIQNLTIESKKLSLLKAVTPEIVNQPAIYGILGKKYYSAINKNIKFILKVDSDISNISFNFTQLSRILGILLDNAIEASEESDLPWITMKFTYDEAKTADIIQIRNAVADGSKIDSKKIFKKGVSSKKIKSGIGLWEVKKILASKSNSHIYTDVVNNEFTQTIVIENNKSNLPMTYELNKML